jgi:hypothetical protein
MWKSISTRCVGGVVQVGQVGRGRKTRTSRSAGTWSREG